MTWTSDDRLDRKMSALDPDTFGTSLQDLFLKGSHIPLSQEISCDFVFFAIYGNDIIFDLCPYFVAKVIDRVIQVNDLRIIPGKSLRSRPNTRP